MTDKPSLDSILSQALEIADPNEQVDFLNQACGGDEEMRA